MGILDLNGQSKHSLSDIADHPRLMPQAIGLFWDYRIETGFLDLGHQQYTANYESRPIRTRL
jgi:hypothetical protein